MILGPLVAAQRKIHTFPTSKTNPMAENVFPTISELTTCHIDVVN